MRVITKFDYTVSNDFPVFSGYFPLKTPGIAFKTEGGFMTIVEMLEQSGVLTLLGMGVVFSFLAILIVAVTLVGKFIHAIGADKDLNQPAKTGTGAPANSAAKATAVTAAITAAVTEYRKTNP
jgi:oxaloacetate decarboxylase gamma subunit